MIKFGTFAAAAGVALFMSAGVQAAPFNGFYLGVEAGGGWGDANQTRYGNIGGAPVFTQADASLDGAVYGVYAGRDWSIGPKWIFGIEGNWDASSIAGDDNGSGGDINEWDQNWEASLRARVGVLLAPGTLLYATTGYSWADFDANVLNAPVSSRSNTFGGWTLGAGIECALAPNLTGRVQYRYNDYSSEDVSHAPETYYIVAGPTVQTLAVGLGWSF